MDRKSRRVRVTQVERAESFLVERIREARERNATYLEPIHPLASAAGVSYVTMWKAVRNLRVRGMLAISRSRRIVVTDADAPVADAGPLGVARKVGGKKWQRLVAAMYHDILNGRFEPSHALPHTKHLLDCYGVSYPTLRKALQKLAADGMLSQDGRSFTVTASSAMRVSGRTIVVMYRHFPKANRVSSISYSVLQELQTRCSRAGLRVETVAYRTRNGRLSVDNDERYPDFASRPDVAGVCLIANAMAWIVDIYKLLAGILRRKLAVAVCDEGGSVDYLYAHGHNPLLRVFSISHSPRCGYLMGRYLLRRRATSVFYVGYAGVQWSANRYEGLRTAFKEAGIALPPPCDIMAREKESSRAFGDVLRGIRERYADSDVVLRTLDELYSTMGEHYRRSYVAVHSRDELSRFLDAEKGRSWCIAANDALACILQDLIREQRPRGTAPMRLVSFDNSIDALDRSISSYSFNTTATVSAMMTHVTDPFSPRFGGSRTPVVEIDGWVVERGSSF